MGMTYTDSYETRKANHSLTVGDVNYNLDYIIKSPIDGKANEVNATFYQGEENERIGYGSYYNGASGVRFDSDSSVPFEVQKAVNEMFMNDLDEILK